MKRKKSSVSGSFTFQLNEIREKFEEEVREIQVLLKFFISTSKELHQFYTNLNKSITVLNNSLKTPWGYIVRQLLNEYTETNSKLESFNSSLVDGIIKPLENFKSSYESRGRRLIDKYQKLCKDIKSKRKEVEKVKQTYYKDNEHVMGLKEVSKEREKKLEEYKKNYKQRYIDFNQSIEKYKGKYKRLCKEWNENNKDKASSIKYSFHSFNNFLDNLSRNALSKDCKEVLDRLNDNMFTACFNKIPKLFDRITVEYPEYVFKSNIIQEKELAEVFPNGIKGEDLKSAQEKLNDILSDKPITKEEGTKLFTIAKTKEGIHMLCKELSKVTNRIPLKNKTSLYIISNLSSIILDQLEIANLPEISYLSVLLKIGKFILKSNNTEKKYLREDLINHSIWKHKDVWNRLIEYKTARNSNGSTSSSDSGTHSKPTNKPKKSRFSYFEFEDIIGEMGFYCVNRKIARELVIEYAQNYDISCEKVLQLLIGYESMQRFPHIQITRFKYLQKILRRKERRLDKMKMSIMKAISLGLVSTKDCYMILLVSKTWNKEFKKPILKYLLKACNFNLWRHLLYDERIVSQYKEQNKENDYNYIINMDVKRSFRDYSEEFRNSLENVLNAYASYNKDVNYCQGMNCIAGFLLTLCNDESHTFSLFSTLISKYNLSSLFKEGVPLLKSYFFQLNRLIAIYLPRLHAHFSEEKVRVEYFTLPWLLTIFTFTMQNVKEHKTPPLLLCVFNDFLMSGVSAIFKCALFLLDRFGEDLLMLNCENLMKFFNEEEFHSYFAKPKTEQEYKAKYKKYNISFELLEWLDTEYNELLKISQQVNDVSVERLFKHYIEFEGKYMEICIEY